MQENRDWLKLLRAVGFEVDDKSNSKDGERQDYWLPSIKLDGDIQIIHKVYEKPSEVTLSKMAKEFLTEHPTGILALEDWVEKCEVVLDIDQYGGKLSIGRIEYYWGNRCVKYTNGYNINCASKREAYIEAAFYRLEMEG